MFWNDKGLLKTYEWLETYKNLWKLMNDLKVIKAYEWLEKLLNLKKIFWKFRKTYEN